MVCDYAEKHGMQSIFLFPRESIRRNLETAAALAVSICQQTSQNLQLSTIVNNSKQGILFVDQREVIFLSNPIALQYLDAPQEEVMGKKLERYFSRSDVGLMYASGETCRIFCSIKGRALVVTGIPIISKQEISNLLVYMEDVGEIQKTERAIRRETWFQKGFVAKYTFEQYRSADRDFHDFLSLAKSFAKTDEPIVILGETGSGKEMLAQSIHNYSPRADKAFVAVNCAAISEQLLESELFGYNEGAFTGALKGGKEGYFEMAHMGTIFLDEIGEMSPALQSKILRVVQERQVLRVGGTKLIPFDARIIVATNRNLWELVQNKAFRMDLYYRLNVLELEIPPLRARPDDIILLLEEFLRKLSPPTWKVISHFSGELERHLSAYRWPGNVRELENFAHSLVASLTPGDPPLKLINLIAENLNRKSQRDSRSLLPVSPVPEAPRAGDSKAGGPRTAAGLRGSLGRQIEEALKNCNGNIPQAARILGIHRSTLWRKLRTP
ncbi:MAG: sigma 54-interacting transcriptional regulator [Treponema sp.]|jgi:propionate catabolism operon transcriptional regulator|nr:sigma 54-interacting transcriptional regulator [Treponema sp.]